LSSTPIACTSSAPMRSSGVNAVFDRSIESLSASYADTSARVFAKLQSSPRRSSISTSPLIAGAMNRVIASLIIKASGSSHFPS